MGAIGEKVFADQSAKRLARIHEIRSNWKSSGLNKICIVAPSQFRLWDDTGAAFDSAMGGSRFLSALDKPEALNLPIGKSRHLPGRPLALPLSSEYRGEGTHVRFDPDDPASASSLALAQAASQCNALVTPNLGRGELPDIISDAMPWITWVTAPRIPAFVKAGLRDALIVADPAWKAAAIERGWAADQVWIGTWPLRSGIANASGEASLAGVFRVPPKPHLALISDTRRLDPPERVEEYSSHRLLWESIGEELLSNPFAVKHDVNAYLTGRMKQAHIESEGFDREAFLNGVILHAYQQGIARLLASQGFPLKLFGKGWEECEDLRPLAGGLIRSREELDLAMQSAAAFVHAWPIFHAHPIDSTGKPVIRPGSPPNDFLHDCKLALSGKISARPSRIPALSIEIIMDALKAR